MDRYLQHVDVAAANPDEINCRADIALIRMGQDGPGTTLIDVTLAAHNIHQPGPDYTVGLAANNSALRKHQFYSRLYQPPGPDFRKLANSSAITSLLAPHITRPGVWKHYQNNLSVPSDSSGEVCSHCTHTIYPRSASHISLHYWSSCPPDPPSRLYPDHQLPRHDAVPSLSRRPLLLQSRALASSPPPSIPVPPVMLSLA